jgi:hypothetical protein
MNSVAVILRHLGGDLLSRWTDFRTPDGEKPDRDRDREFLDWDGDRGSLLAHFDAGWDALIAAIRQLDAIDADQPVLMQGERHSLADALMRSLTHVSYHAGQITMIARIVHDGDWRWLPIPPGRSAEHDARTWNRAASRSVLGDGTSASCSLMARPTTKAALLAAGDAGLKLLIEEIDALPPEVRAREFACEGGDRTIRDVLCHLSG